MKMETFRLINEQVAANVVAKACEVPHDGSIEVVFRNAQEGKTLQQLGALFGLWIKEISDQMARDERWVHRMLKANYLARIYIIEPLTPEQESWVELSAIYQQTQQQEKLTKHAKRISLSWATLQQTKDYMNAVQNGMADDGILLTPPDKFHKLRDL